MPALIFPLRRTRLSKSLCICLEPCRGRFVTAALSVVLLLRIALLHAVGPLFAHLILSIDGDKAR